MFDAGDKGQDVPRPVEAEVAALVAETRALPLDLQRRLITELREESPSCEDSARAHLAEAQGRAP